MHWKNITDRKKKYKAYIISAEWAKIRADIIILRGGKCELCGKNGKQVHHITYERLFDEEPDDLILLCNRCHMGEHGKLPAKKKRNLQHKKKKRKAKTKKVFNERGLLVTVRIKNKKKKK